MWVVLVQFVALSLVDWEYRAIMLVAVLVVVSCAALVVAILAYPFVTLRAPFSGLPLLLPPLVPRLLPLFLSLNPLLFNLLFFLFPTGNVEEEEGVEFHPMEGLLEEVRLACSLITVTTTIMAAAHRLRLIVAPEAAWRREGGERWVGTEGGGMVVEEEQLLGDENVEAGQLVVEEKFETGEDQTTSSLHKMQSITSYIYIKKSNNLVLTHFSCYDVFVLSRFVESILLYLLLLLRSSSSNRPPPPLIIPSAHLLSLALLLLLLLSPWLSLCSVFLYITYHSIYRFLRYYLF
eukprot:GHVS01042800.1.p1 GENE.GHVS01042800.1~~GHVS01042800.1.p1  ORF type:complete len:292 (-),score=71.64 GHVS01042800.1:757-1632(-)